MGVVVGIDEAGYGPTLGPLVLGLSAFRVPDGEADLYHTLAPLVSREPDPQDPRVAVNDSKKLYAQRRSLGDLERGALAFLHPGEDLPRSLEDLTPGLAAARWPAWYRTAPTIPELPAAVEAGAAAETRQRLAAELPRCGVTLAACSGFPVLEGPFNHSLERTRNKAVTHLGFVARVLEEVWQRFPDEDLVVRVDRIGGRRYYGDFLAAQFPWEPLRVLEEGPSCSRYEIRTRRQRILVSFEVEADALHLPVALASMCAKYVRELFLRRLNHHFAGLVPGLRPTAGYPQDAGRFLDDIAPVLDRRLRTQLIRML